MADYSDYTSGQVLNAADLNSKLVTPVNSIGGDDLEDGIVTANSGPDIQFTIGTEAANVIRVTLQIEKANGTDITTERAALECWLADSQNAGETAAAPSGGWAVVTGYKAFDHTANKSAVFVTDATGKLAIDITETGAKTFWLHVRAGSRVAVSGAITFV